MKQLLIPILALTLLSACTPEPISQEELRNASTDSQPETSTNTFRYDPAIASYHGEVTVTGYPELTTRETPFCTANCETYEYLLFKISEINNSALKDYIQQLQGNAYVGQESIGLGCLTNGILQYSNSSDELGAISQEFSTEETEQILNSTSEYPITLSLTRYPLTQEMGATECYSHFSEIVIVD